MECQFSMHN